MFEIAAYFKYAILFENIIASLGVIFIFVILSDVRDMKNA